MSKYRTVTKRLLFDLSNLVINVYPMLPEDLKLIRGENIIHFENEYVSSINCFGQWLVYVWYGGMSEPIIYDHPDDLHKLIEFLRTERNFQLNAPILNLIA